MKDIERQIESAKWGIKYDVVTMDYSSLYPSQFDLLRMEKVAEELERKLKIKMREERLDKIIGTSSNGHQSL